METVEGLVAWMDHIHEHLRSTQKRLLNRLERPKQVAKTRKQSPWEARSIGAVLHFHTRAAFSFYLLGTAYSSSWGTTFSSSYLGTAFSLYSLRTGFSSPFLRTAFSFYPLETAFSLYCLGASIWAVLVWYTQVVQIAWAQEYKMLQQLHYTNVAPCHFIKSHQRLFHQVLSFETLMSCY